MNHNYEVCGLDFKKGEVNEFIVKQLFKETELASKIIDSLSKNHNDHKHIHTFLKNPLLLLLYIIKFQTNAGISAKKSQFYRDVIEALFYRHDSISKYWSGRERVCGLNQEQFEYILTRFSYISFFEGNYADWDMDYINSKLELIKKNNISLLFQNRHFIVDMQIGLGLWVEDANLYSFTHRSLQEYFAALSIMQVKSDLKEQVYKRIKKNTEKMDYEKKYHLLSLLEEMDSLAFYKYYALPYLTEIENIFKSEAPENMVINDEKHTIYLGDGAKRLFDIKYAYFTRGMSLYFIANEQGREYATSLFLRDMEFEYFKIFRISRIKFQDIIFRPIIRESFSASLEHGGILNTNEYEIAKVKIENDINNIKQYIKQAEESDILFLDLI